MRRASCKEERTILARSWTTESILAALEAGWPEGEGKPARALQNEVAYSHLNVPGDAGRTRNSRLAVWGRLEITVSIALLSVFSIEPLPTNSTALPNSGAAGNKVLKGLEPLG